MATELHDLSIAELVAPDRGAQALARRADRRAHPAHRAARRPDARLHHAHVRSGAAAGAGRPRPRSPRAGSRGPLHGIPFALKDIYDTRGHPHLRRTRASSSTASPPRTPPRPRKLYEAGAVLLGKLATHEMAHAGPSFDLPWPPARNPWNLAHFTGGSSTGSGAAVAAGLVPVALGSDTGGSIRGPGLALRRRRPHADVRPREPRRRHHQLVHVRPLRAAGAHGRGLRADCCRRWPATTRRTRAACGGRSPAIATALGAGPARAADRRASPPLGGGHPGLRGRARGDGRRARRAAPARRRARGVPRAPARRATSTSRSSSRRARSSASTRRT